MAMPLWRRVRAAVAGRIRQRVTKAGLGFSLAVTMVGFLAFLSANNLLFLLLACLLAAWLWSGFLSRLSLAGLELDFVFPEHVPARRKVAARMKLRNEKTWMPSFSIHVAGAPGCVFSSAVYFPMLPAGATVEETVEIQFARRGEYKENSFRLWSHFPFGFAKREVRVTLRREALVYPCLEPQPMSRVILQRLQGEMDAAIRGRGSDFYRIRPYEHRESARHVDWRATAHTGELQVREFSRDQDPLVEIFLDLDVPEGEYEWFESAVDCAAHLCWETSARPARVRLRTQAFDREAPTEVDVYTMLKYLALVEPKRSKIVLGPSREDSLQVVLSARPPRFTAAGWNSAQLVGLDAFGTAESTGSGETRNRS